VRMTGMLTMSTYSRARRCNVPRASLRPSNARPRMGRPLGPGGAWVPLFVILAGSSSLHPRIIRNVKPTEDALDDHPKDRVVNAPGQCYGEHAAESPDADTSSARCHRCSLGFSLHVKSCGASLTR